MTDTHEAVRLVDNGGWIDAQSRVPDVVPSAGISLPVLAIAETDDACFQQTMAVYYSKGRSGLKFPHWRAERFDDDRDGPVVKVRCWMPRPTFPKTIPGNWGDQPARSAIQAEFDQLKAEIDEQARLNGMGAERELALMAKMERMRANSDRWEWIADGNNFDESFALLTDPALTTDLLTRKVDAAIATQAKGSDK